VASFLLTPCKIREGWLVPQKDTAQLTLEWPALCALLAPSGTVQAKASLRKGAAPSAYAVLLSHPSGFVSNVLLRNADLSGDIRGVLKRDPSFESRVVGAFRFEQVSWDAGVVEPSAIR
jgi:hypothetical protein